MATLVVKTLAVFSHALAVDETMEATQLLQSALEVDQPIMAIDGAEDSTIEDDVMLQLDQELATDAMEEMEEDTQLLQATVELDGTIMVADEGVDTLQLDGKIFDETQDVCPLASDWSADESAVVGVVSAYSQCLKDHCIDQNSFMFQGPNGPTSCSTLLGMGATCSTPFRYGITFGDVCPTSCGKCSGPVCPLASDWSADEHDKVASVVSAYSRCLKDNCIDQDSFMFQGPNGPTKCSTILGMGATCSTPFRYGITFGDVCPTSCGTCTQADTAPATTQKPKQEPTPKPLENPFCVKIVTGKSKYDDGYVRVLIDTGKAFKKYTSGKKKFGLGSIVLQKCFPNPIQSVLVNNKNKNAWIGSIQYSTDGGKTYNSMKCTNCAKGSETSEIAVDGNADSKTPTRCNDGKQCIIKPL